MISTYRILLESRVELLRKMEQKEDLLNGNLLRCPRCKKEHSVESYLRLSEAEQYKKFTVPIYKCSSCKWIFALQVIIPYEELTTLISTRQSIAREGEKVK